MGNYYIVFRALLEGLGLEVLVPPPITRKTVELACKYAPEFPCFPFKVNLGNMIEALELGVDVLLQAGGKGACRYGYYAEVQRKILKDLGYEFRLMKIFEGTDIKEDYRRLKALNRDLTNLQIFNAFKIAWAKMRAIDVIEDLIRRIRPYEVNRGQTVKLHRQFLKQVDGAQSFSQIRKVREDFLRRLSSIEKDPQRRPLKVGIVGELFIVMEPYSNLNIEDKLGQMGVEIIRPLNLTEILTGKINFPHRARLRRIARPYLRYESGAHANVSVAETILFAREGLDGVIHVKPFACMPEVTAMSALYRVSRDYNIPVLFFSFDEHTSSVGVQTRLEAFVELLKRRKSMKPRPSPLCKISLDKEA